MIKTKLDNKEWREGIGMNTPWPQCRLPGQPGTTSRGGQLESNSRGVRTVIILYLYQNEATPRKLHRGPTSKGGGQIRQNTQVVGGELTAWGGAYYIMGE